MVVAPGITLQKPLGSPNNAHPGLLAGLASTMGPFSKDRLT